MPLNNPSHASHIVGHSLAYECISANVYVIQYAKYASCSTWDTLFNGALTINGIGTGCTQPARSGWNTVSVIDITPLGPGIATDCNGGPPGSFNGTFEAIIHDTLDFTGATCLEYDLTYSNCCRNGAITSGSANQSFYLEAGTIRPGAGPCNSAPQWRNPGLVYIPIGGGVFDVGAFDPEGDSVVHKLTSCYAGAGMTANYNAGYSPTQPLGPNWNVSLDAASGLLTITPISASVVVGSVCITAEEYRNGVLIGRSSKDIGYYISSLPCTPSAAPTFTGITNLTNGFLYGSSPNADTLSLPPGAPFCFDINTFDPDTGADQTLSWTQNLVGATFTNLANTQSTTLIDEDPTGRLCWTTPTTAGIYDLAFTLKDSSCNNQVVVPHYVTLVVGDTANVWPGDANDDNVANNQDVLALGLAFSATGPTRPGASNAWIGQPALPWIDTIPGGIDQKFQDCNGDGTVNADDTLAISLNYGLVHSKGRIAQRGAATDPPLRLIIPQDSANVGDTITATIILGDSSIMANNIYGLAFSLNYDASLIDSTTFDLQFAPSWLGNASNSLTLDRNFPTLAHCDGVQVRTDHQNVSGLGQIATATFVIIDNIDGKRQELISETLNFFFSDVVVISATGELIPVDPTADSLVVYDLSTEFFGGPATAASLELYPNPANEAVTLTATGQTIQEIELWTVHGQQVWRQAGPAQEKFRLPTAQLQTGVYFVKVRTDWGRFTRRLAVQR